MLLGFLAESREKSPRVSDIEIPELLWQMVEEGNKRLRDLGLLEVMLCEATRPKRGLCSLRRLRKHTIYQDHNECAGVSIISIIKGSVIALFCRPGLMVDTITETSLLIAKGPAGP